MTVQYRELDDVDNWSWKQLQPSDDSIHDTGGWSKAHCMPSEVHVELLKGGMIPDPYIGFNEHQVECKAFVTSGLYSDHSNQIGIADAEWLYKYTFAHNHTHLHALLVFEGLDTICDVYLVCSAWHDDK